MNLNLSPEEVRELRDLLSGVLTDLRSEIHHTDSAEYRRGLKARDRVLRGVWEQLGAFELVT